MSFIEYNTTRKTKNVLLTIWHIHVKNPGMSLFVYQIVYGYTILVNYLYTIISASVDISLKVGIPNQHFHL